MSARQLLDELEALGATGTTKPAEKTLPLSNKTSAAISVTEERAEKMVRIADIVVDELSVLIDAASRMREALLEMKTMWSPNEEIEGEVETEDYVEESSSQEEDIEEDTSFEEDDEDPYDRPMNAIAVFVPEPVPLPPDVAALED